jgi:hypothetical protein
LKKDHQEAKDLFKNILSGKGDKKALFAELRQELMSLFKEGTSYSSFKEAERLFLPLKTLQSQKHL